MTTQEDGVFPPDAVSAVGRHAALVLGSKVRQWPLVLGSFSKARSWPPLWPLNFLWTTTCSGVRVCSEAPTRTTYLDGSLPNLEDRGEREWWRRELVHRDVRWCHWRSPPARELIYSSALPADTVRRCQSPAGADQRAATERTAIFFVRLKPHWHLPWPRGPDREWEKMSVKMKVSLLTGPLDPEGAFWWVTLQSLFLWKLHRVPLIAN